MSSLMETVRALRHRHDFRGDVFLSATVTGVPRAGINDPLRQISNDSNMRTAMENKDPRCLSCGEQEVNMTCAEQLAGFVSRASFDDISNAARLQLKIDRKSTRLNSSHTVISYAVFCLKKKK